MSHLDSLNAAQKDAVTTTEGPLMVIAGAGAGKTRVIAHRILEIVRHGTAPEHILAITFTNKSAKEMRERVLKLLNEDAGNSRPAFEPFKPPFVSTFHSLGLTIIKENHKLLGYKRTPMIYDRNDSMRTIKEALKRFGFENLEARACLGKISRQKSDGVTADSFTRKSERNPYDKMVAQVWMQYEKALREDGALDFDDLLSVARSILTGYTAVREHYQKRWRYVHVDEFQDTNGIQAEMVEMLLGPENNICVVGDVDQTIYGWRGAQIANMLAFEKKYPNTKVVLLEQNYRSTKNIIAAANEVISKNAVRPEKTLFTENEDGELISLYRAFDETDEAGYVARIIKELVGEGTQPRDIAVLYRANYQSRAIEEQLLHSGVAYQVLGTKFFERKEVKDVVSYIRAALGGASADVARVANTPARGIGKVTLAKMLEGHEETLSGAVGVKVAAFRALLQRIESAAHQLAPSELVKYVAKESGIETILKEDKTEGKERLENVQELVSLASRFDLVPGDPKGDGTTDAIESFLESAALMSDQDEMKTEQNAARLMTVHAAKGLEFKNVFVTGLEEGLFPYEREGENDRDKEEERRLMYVALTRAEKKLHLTYASYRTVFGSKNATSPSSFLADIPDDLIELANPERVGRTIYLD